ncbi:NAD(P)-dependent oxidoreductase [Pseudoduganella namucuonensis]|uniref:3-hydroxyisobutyrate dehydrogenase n=1 Tax=Pseudoduganella namucuonensis TaxID=1035707 RepID=A0A1I7G513_9BURK|nr:NAD(P)-dependent oxidoreductase [Pseudoduganella namucuonensis]SFU43513.1 3-hydroxyisobutyrate dehydrogenase [Pseudoduganella namucuonensis]
MDAPSQIVGMIGIGQLGLPIATNLIQAGYQVAGFRRTGREEFAARGGHALASPAAVARQADILLLCLPSEQAQLDVLEGPDGVLAALKPGQIVIELSTYGKAFKLEQAKRIEERGGRVLESEVSGSPPMVAQRKASLYLGGSASLIEECKPVLDAITANHFHIGEFGSAVAMKLIANYLLSIHILAAAEAMNLGAMAGFDPRMVAEVIKHGAGSSTMFTIRAPMMAERAFTPAIGPFVTLKKYLDLGRDMSDELGAASPLFSAAASYFYRAIDSDIRDEDAAAVIKLLEAESQQNTHQGE